MLKGGWSDTKPATAEIQEIADKVKSQLEKKENRKFSVFKAVSYRSQVVAGTNYFIKVDVGDGEFIHMKVFESLPHENKPLSLQSYQTKKTQDDALEYC
uniref:cystatin-B-like n=1 Tax=Jaculus jaculus TaxID=51337 RepID=UPI001E1B2AAC|nr:cystatin-B-like [Jaculus jaculus]